MLRVPHGGELAVLRARVAELEARLPERDAQLEAAQARLEVLAGQAEELRRRLGRDSATPSKPPSPDSPYQKKPKDRPLATSRHPTRLNSYRCVDIKQVTVADRR